MRGCAGLEEYAAWRGFVEGTSAIRSRRSADEG